MFELICLFILLGSMLAMVMLVWFETSAFVEYLNLFGLQSLAKVHEYNEVTKDDFISYPQYIVQNYPSFFTRMLGCPKCLCIQLAMVLNFFLLPVAMILTGSILVLFLYIPSVLATAYSGLCLYYLLVKLIKQ